MSEGLDSLRAAIRQVKDILNDVSDCEDLSPTVQRIIEGALIELENAEALQANKEGNEVDHDR